jgi:hypothetical protein
VALAGHGFNVVVVAQWSGAVNALKQGPSKIMLNQPETYLTFSNIDWTFSNLDLSHHYLLMLKITKSG